MVDEVRTVAVFLPVPDRGLIGVPYEVEGLATFRCRAGQVEVVNGVKFIHPPFWVREVADGDQ